MANDEHVDILKQTARSWADFVFGRSNKEPENLWNRWRTENPEIKPDLSGAVLTGKILGPAILKTTNLRNANLRSIRFNSEDIMDKDGSLFGIVPVDLRGADFSYASLDKANLTDAFLDDAILTGATLTSTNFTGASLLGADFTCATMGRTIFGKNNLSKAKALDTVTHKGPSSIDVSTIYYSSGNLPRTFLEGIGIPENLINYLQSLTREAFQFYSCFISYTESDALFSERLYNDLQSAGIRCWRWKEDAQWGKTLMHSIDEAVRIYDKLIVICSENSLRSPAVIREIERALQKEDELARQGKDNDVLFPIRLDDYIFRHWSHHRKADILAKNIGDFRDWGNPKSYTSSLERLMRDLKASSPDKSRT